MPNPRPDRNHPGPKTEIQMESDNFLVPPPASRTITIDPCKDDQRQSRLSRYRMPRIHPSRKRAPNPRRHRFCVDQSSLIISYLVRIRIHRVGNGMLDPRGLPICLTPVNHSQNTDQTRADLQHHSPATHPEPKPRGIKTPQLSDVSTVRIRQPVNSELDAIRLPCVQVRQVGSGLPGPFDIPTETRVSRGRVHASPVRAECLSRHSAQAIPQPRPSPACPHRLVARRRTARFEASRKGCLDTWPGTPSVPADLAWPFDRSLRVVPSVDQPSPCPLTITLTPRRSSA